MVIPEDAAISIYLSIPTLLGAMFFGIIKNDILKEDIDILMTFSSILISFIDFHNKMVFIVCKKSRISSIYHLQAIFGSFDSVVDIKEIVCREKSFISEAEYHSNKYQIPVNSISSENCYIDLSLENFLVFKQKRISNLFHKILFSEGLRIIKGKYAQKSDFLSGWQTKSILDATAGLGRDGFICALLGQEVTMVEENKGMCILIESALKRLPNRSYFNDAKNRINVINADSSKIN